MWLGEHLKQNLMKILWDTYGVSNNHKQSPFFQIHLQDSGIIFFSVWMGLYLLAYTWKETERNLMGLTSFWLKIIQKWKSYMLNCCIKLNLVTYNIHKVQLNFISKTWERLQLKNSLLWKDHWANFGWNKLSLQTSQKLHFMIMHISF